MIQFSTHEKPHFSKSSKPASEATEIRTSGHQIHALQAKHHPNRLSNGHDMCSPEPKHYPSRWLRAPNCINNNVLGTIFGSKSDVHVATECINSFAFSMQIDLTGLQNGKPLAFDAQMASDSNFTKKVELFETLFFNFLNFRIKWRLFWKFQTFFDLFLGFETQKVALRLFEFWASLKIIVAVFLFNLKLIFVI